MFDEKAKMTEQKPNWKQTRQQERICFHIKKEEMTQQQMRKWKTTYHLSQAAIMQIMGDETNVQEKI